MVEMSAMERATALMDNFQKDDMSKWVGGFKSDTARTIEESATAKVWNYLCGEIAKEIQAAENAARERAAMILDAGIVLCSDGEGNPPEAYSCCDATLKVYMDKVRALTDKEK